MQETFSIFYFLILIFSIIVHEVAHGLAAEQEGDSTARMLGRITLNPIKHIDWFGSIILPFILIISQAGIVVGWAKPVPYNPDNLRRGKTSIAKVAIAGIVVNLGIAVLFGLLIRFGVHAGVLPAAFIEIASIVVLTNIVLALFNAIPLAPLDGFNFLSALLPRKYDAFMQTLSTYSMYLLILFILFGWRILSPLAFNLYTLITGITV